MANVEEVIRQILQELIYNTSNAQSEILEQCGDVPLLWTTFTSEINVLVQEFLGCTAACTDIMPLTPNHNNEIEEHAIEHSVAPYRLYLREPIQHASSTLMSSPICSPLYIPNDLSRPHSPAEPVSRSPSTESDTVEVLPNLIATSYPPQDTASSTDTDPDEGQLSTRRHRELPKGNADEPGSLTPDQSDNPGRVKKRPRLASRQMDARRKRIRLAPERSSTEREDIEVISCERSAHYKDKTWNEDDILSKFKGQDDMKSRARGVLKGLGDTQCLVALCKLLQEGPATADNIPSEISPASVVQFCRTIMARQAVINHKALQQWHDCLRLYRHVQQQLSPESNSLWEVTTSVSASRNPSPVKGNPRQLTEAKIARYITEALTNKELHDHQNDTVLKRRLQCLVKSSKRLSRFADRFGEGSLGMLFVMDSTKENLGFQTHIIFQLSDKDYTHFLDEIQRTQGQYIRELGDVLRQIPGYITGVSSNEQNSHLMALLSAIKSTGMSKGFKLLQALKKPGVPSYT